MLIDLELTRCARALEGGEQYPGEAIEGAIACLQSDIADCGNGSDACLRKLRTLAERLIDRIDQRLAIRNRVERRQL